VYWRNIQHFFAAFSAKYRATECRDGTGIGEKRRTLHFSEIRGEKEERPREGRVDSLRFRRVDLSRIYLTADPRLARVH